MVRSAAVAPSPVTALEATLLHTPRKGIRLGKYQRVSTISRKCNGNQINPLFSGRKTTLQGWCNGKNGPDNKIHICNFYNISKHICINYFYFQFLCIFVFICELSEIIYIIAYVANYNAIGMQHALLRFPKSGNTLAEFNGKGVSAT